jgi:hypothetical protein
MFSADAIASEMVILFIIKKWGEKKEGQGKLTIVRTEHVNDVQQPNPSRRRSYQPTIHPGQHPPIKIKSQLTEVFMSGTRKDERRKSDSNQRCKIVWLFALPIVKAHLATTGAASEIIIGKAKSLRECSP